MIPLCGRALCAAGLLWGGDRQRYRLYGLLQLSPGRVVHLHVLSVCDHDRAHIPPCGYRGGMCSDIDQLVAARTASLRGEL